MKDFIERSKPYAIVLGGGVVVGFVLGMYISIRANKTEINTK